MGTRRRFLQPQHTSGGRVCWLHAARPPATHVAPAAPALLLHSLHKHLRSVCGGPGAALAAGATAASKAGQSPCPHGALLREDRPSPRKRTLCWESPSVAAARPGGSKGPSRRGFPRELTPERRPCLRDPGDPGYMKTRRLAGRWARRGGSPPLSRAGLLQRLLTMRLLSLRISFSGSVSSSQFFSVP